MGNLISGIVVILICLGGYFIAYKQFKKKAFTSSIWIIILCGLLLRMYTASDFYLHKWDERFHAVVAKNMIEDPLVPKLYNNPVLDYDYRNWTGNHIWIHKQPIPLLFMAASMKCLGVNELAMRLPSILMSTIGIGILFLIGSILYNKRTGLIAAFLYSINGLIVELSAGRVATDHIDIAFLFFIQLAVLLILLYRHYQKTFINILCGICIGLAILSKWLPALIVLPIWLILILGSGKFTSKEVVLNFLLLLISMVVTFLPWQVYIFSQFPLEASWERGFNIKHITETLDDQSGSIFYHINKVRIIFGELVYLPLLWFSWKTIKSIKRPDPTKLALFIWFWLPLLFFSIVKTKMQAYTLFTAPAIFLIIALFWEFMYRYRNQMNYPKLVIVLLFLLIALPVRYSIERIKPLSIRPRTVKWVEEIRKVDNEMRSRNDIVIFNVKHPVELMFYTNWTAYSSIPDIEKLKEIRSSGYTIFINRSKRDDKFSNKPEYIDYLEIEGM